MDDVIVLIIIIALVVILGKKQTSNDRGLRAIPFEGRMPPVPGASRKNKVIK
jgi:hypothetical protein